MFFRWAEYNQYFGGKLCRRKNSYSSHCVGVPYVLNFIAIAAVLGFALAFARVLCILVKGQVRQRPSR
jgi:hypothetical protein